MRSRVPKVRAVADVVKIVVGTARAYMDCSCAGNTAVRIERHTGGP
jgi:hypothetical protein